VPRRGAVTGTAVADRDGFPPYRWVSPARAAALLGISLRDLYALVDSGQLPAYRIAGEVKLLARDVDDWQRRHGPPSPGPDRPP
jgi:excisionase family DNA binding protein